MHNNLINVIFVISVCLMYGCSPGNEAQGRYPVIGSNGKISYSQVPDLPGEPVLTLGDYRYVHPAVLRAVEKCSLAIESHEQTREGTHVYTLLTTNNQPGYLVIEKIDAGAAARARIGYYGDPDLQDKLLRIFRDRFAALQSGDPVP